MTQAAQLAIPPDAAERQDRLAAILAASGLLITAACGWLSPEGLVHFDDLTHFLIARMSWKWPAYLLDEWGRPGFTVLYALPARLGWPMCRALSAILSTWSAWFAYRIAQRAGLRWAWAVVPLCFIQPLFFQLAETTLTETALAFYLTLAVFLAQYGRWSFSAAILSLGFITRHEAAVFLPIWVFFARRRGIPLWRLWTLIWAPVAVNLLDPLAGLPPVFLRLLHHESTGQYGRGSWFTFLSRSMEAFGPAVAALALSGIWTLARERKTSLAAASIGVYFVTETAIRALGLYDSGGYARFLVAISPLVAISALAGLHPLFDADPRRRAAAAAWVGAAMLLLWFAMERHFEWASRDRDILAEIPRLYQAHIAVTWTTRAFVTIAALHAGLFRLPAAARLLRPLMPVALLLVAALTCYELCHPLYPPAEAPIVRDTLAWLKEHGYGDRPLISAVVWIDYKTDRPLPPDRPSVREQIVQAPLGTIFAWEEKFAGCPDHNLQLREFTSSPAFRPIYESGPLPWQSRPYLTLLEKIGAWDGRPSIPQRVPTSMHAPP